jgi:hypothetical protein
MVIAAIYVAVITQLPNRAYYDYLRDMDSANLQRVTSNVFIYSVLELLSLVILDAVIRWRLKFSLLTQLAFVLEKQRKTIISKLVLWIVYIIQGSLQHYGKPSVRRSLAASVACQSADPQSVVPDYRDRLHVPVRMATGRKEIVDDLDQTMNLALIVSRQ